MNVLALAAELLKVSEKRGGSQPAVHRNCHLLTVFCLLLADCLINSSALPANPNNMELYFY